MMYLCLAAVLCAAATLIWVWHDQQRKPRWIPPEIEPPIVRDVPADERVWLKCSPLEYRPISAGDLTPGDVFMFDEAYHRMQLREAQLADQEFWSALAEIEDADTAEMETIPDDEMPGDNWPEFGDLGGGDAR